MRKVTTLTTAEAEMARRIGARAAQSVRSGATHLDAITTQMQASGIDNGDPTYMLVGRTALNTLLEEVPYWEGPVKRSHTAGWSEFAGAGEPAPGGEVEAEELEGFQILDNHGKSK